MDNKLKLDALYAEVRAWGSSETRHHFDLGKMYAREERLKAGQVVCMHVHDYDHFSLYVGHVRLVTDRGEDELLGAGTIYIRRGERHAVLAVTDSLWICAHQDVNREADFAIPGISHA